PPFRLILLGQRRQAVDAAQEGAGVAEVAADQRQQRRGEQGDPLGGPHGRGYLPNGGHAFAPSPLRGGGWGRSRSGADLPPRPPFPAREGGDRPVTRRRATGRRAAATVPGSAGSVR